jgi:hypothetical protein
MKKLSKEQAATLARHVEALNSAADNVRVAVEVFNDAVQAAWAKVEEARDAYNDEVSAAADFADGIYGEQQDYFGERSEKWAESEAGEQYQSWMGQWEVVLDELEVGEPPTLDEPEFTAAEALESLPASPGDA